MKAKFALAMLALGFVALAATNSADAAYRQYYSSWRHYPAQQYYYTTYYYKPTPTYPSYNYHYCVYYPSQPRYVYYYNPHAKHYWGRFDCQGAPGAQYSILSQEDRKPELSQIPESAFPKPASMPQIPEAQDKVAVDPPPAVPAVEGQPAPGQAPPAAVPPGAVPAPGGAPGAVPPAAPPAQL